MKGIPHNIYIHVPFCISKCKYCAFMSVACANPDWKKYTDEICHEIVEWGNRTQHTDVPTIFFGGGTPSLMPEKCIEKIINTVNNAFHLTTDAEISAEANPGTINHTKLSGFKNAGINRLSIGVQSFDDKQLEFLGRQHNAVDAIHLIEHAKALGLRISADFIYGIPGDTVKNVKNTCRQINSMGLQHCSMYELTIENGTPFAKMNLDMPDNDTMAQMYIEIGQTLNIPRYEVSNYAAPGQECRHNQNVWDGMPYIGIGRGAAGRPFVDGTWYEQMGGNGSCTPISNQTRAIELVLTGMRTIRGCRLTDAVKNVIDMDWAEKNPELVQIHDDRIRATQNGIMILDEIMVKLVK